MAFSEAEKGRIRHHLGYPSFSSLSQSVQLGYPAASQPLWLVDDSFQRLTPAGEDAVRRDLCECEAIERQISEARTRYKALKLDTLEVNPEERNMLRNDLVYWRQQLASDLSVVINPNAPREYYGAMGGGGVNAVVVG